MYLSPTTEFLKILRMAGAHRDVFTELEILYYLRQYIISRQLYDLDNPSLVHCEEDDLGRAFKVDHFTINDVLYLISCNTVQIYAATIKHSVYSLYSSEESDVFSIQFLSPTTEFLKILQMAGAQKDVFTELEILYYLRQYIMSRQLYDLDDPSVVHCGQDDLGRALKVDHFTINDVLYLISCNTIQIYTSTIEHTSVYSLYSSEQSDVPSIQGYETTVVQYSREYSKDDLLIEETNSSEVVEYEINSGYTTEVDSSDTSDTESNSEISSEEYFMDNWRCSPRDSTRCSDDNPTFSPYITLHTNNAATNKYRPTPSSLPHIDNNDANYTIISSPTDKSPTEL